MARQTTPSPGQGEGLSVNQGLILAGTEAVSVHPGEEPELTTGWSAFVFQLTH